MPVNIYNPPSRRGRGGGAGGPKRRRAARQHARRLHRAPKLRIPKHIKAERRRTTLSSPIKAQRKLNQLSLGAAPNPYLSKAQQGLFSDIVNKYGDGDPLRARTVLKSKAERRLSERGESFGEQLLEGGVVGLVDPQASAAVRKATFGTKNPSAIEAALAAPLPLFGAARAVRAGSRLLRGGERVAEPAAKVVTKAPKPRIRPKPTQARAVRAGPKPRVRPKPAPKPRQTQAPLGWAARRRAARLRQADIKAARPLRGAPRRAGRKAVAPLTRAGGKAAEKLVTTKGGRAALTTARVTTAPARFAARRPVVSALAAPIAVGGGKSIEEGTIEPLQAELEGRGVIAAVGQGIGKVGEVLPGEVAENVVKDVFDLPAQALPSVYIPVAALVEKAKGDPEKFDALWESFKDQSFVAGLVKGDLDQAGEAFKRHPLFSALEVSGVKAVAGRGAGVIGRKAGVKAASKKREPLRLYEGRKVERDYSPDVINKAVQVAAERGTRRFGKDPKTGKRTGRDPNQATPAQIERNILSASRGAGMVDRDVGALRGVSRANRDREIHEALRDRPGGRFKGKIRRAESDGVALAAQRIIRKPESWDDDLLTFEASIRREQREGVYSDSEMRSANDMLDRIDKLRALPPESRNRVFEAADKYVDRMHETTGELVERGPLVAEQAERASLIPYARIHMGARHDGQRLVDPQGRTLTTARIQEHMGQARVAPPGFLTHRPGARRPSDYYRSYEQRQTLPKQGRTGEAAQRGTFDASFEALVDQRIRGRTIIDAIDGFDFIMNRYAVRPKGGYYKNFDRAREAAAALEEKYGISFVPTRLAPLRATKQEIAAAKRRGDVTEESPLEPGSANENILHNMLVESTRETGEGQVVLIPEMVRARLADHFRPSIGFEKGMQSLVTTFKGTVLPTSPKWIMGNILDIGMRSLLAGLGPGDYLLGRRLVSQLERTDPKARMTVEARNLGGAHFSSVMAQKTHRSAEQFIGSEAGGAARAMAAFRRVPGPKQLIDLYQAYAKGVFALNTRLIERPGAVAALGKAVRKDLQVQTGQWRSGFMLGQKAVEDLAKGLRNTDNQVKYARQIEDIYGRWTVNSPGARKLLNDYAPFYMWLRAATRFVGLTLPTKHPIKTGILAAAAEMTADERLKFGLAHDSKEPLPPYLQGSLPGIPGGALPGPLPDLPAGGVLVTEPFTSFGIFADYPTNVADSLFGLPLGTGYNVLRGVDWKGDKLVDSKGRELKGDQRALLAAYSQAEAMTPFLGITRRVLEGGAASEPTSTIFNPTGFDKLKGVSAGLERVFNPFRTYTRAELDDLRKYSRAATITVPLGSGTSESSGSWLDSSSSGGGSWLDSTGSSSKSWLDD